MSDQYHHQVEFQAMNAVAGIKRMVPRRIKDGIKNIIRNHALNSCFHELQKSGSSTPSREFVLRFRETWGNTGFSADVDYLLESIRLARGTEGNILECGSGISTILLASLGIWIHSLEHDPEWLERCRKFLDAHGLRANIIYAPLISYGDFDWYKVPSDLPVPNLILCDGPPGTTRGGRYGLMPTLCNRLGPNCVILLDDAERESEMKIAQRWASEYKMRLTLASSDSGTLAILVNSPV